MFWHVSIPVVTLSPWVILVGLALGRVMDLYSTWYVTPDLVYEANPLYRRLGWRGGILFNVLLVCILPFTLPFYALVATVTSFLVSTHNVRLGLAWRVVGSAKAYDEQVTALTRTRPLLESLYPGLMEFSATIFLACGAFALAPFSPPDLHAVGMGFVVYGLLMLYLMFGVLITWLDQKNKEHEAAKAAGITL